MKTQIEELKQQLKSIAEQIAEIENKNKPWKPEIGDMYYCRGTCYDWRNNETDNYLYNHDLIQPTIESYKQWSKVAQIGKRIKDAIVEGNAMLEAEIKGSWFICMKTLGLNLGIYHTYFENCHLIETSSLQSAEHVIATVGTEDISYYLKNWR